MAELYRAARVAPMTEGLPVFDDGCVVVENGRVLAVGRFADMRADHAGPVRDLGDETLAPATFNSHVHLEMSHLLGEITSGQGFVPWVRDLLAHPLYAVDQPRVRAELLRMEQRGVGFVADISTRNAPLVGEILASSGLSFVSFAEAIGNDVPADAAALLPRVPAVQDSGRGVMSAAGHALYSTGGDLMRAAKDACRAAGLPFSLHLAEHADENMILLEGKSPFLDLLRERGFITHYDAPGELPVALARRLGLLDDATLCVHCVTVSPADIEILAESRATVCLCPRSNAHIGVGQSPAAALIASGVNVCLGTDGLCSNADLDPYGELAVLLEGGLDLGLCEALALVTVNPARFFAGAGVAAAAGLGSLSPGSAARFSIVPRAVLDTMPQS